MAGSSSTSSSSSSSEGNGTRKRRPHELDMRVAGDKRVVAITGAAHECQVIAQVVVVTGVGKGDRVVAITGAAHECLVSAQVVVVTGEA